MSDSIGRYGGGVRAAAVALVSLGVGCLSPTLPMPPPGEPAEYEIGIDRQSLTVRGTAPSPSARVVLLNSTLELESLGSSQEIGKIVIPDRSGNYEATLAADLVTYHRNRIQIWQELDGGENSGVREFSVPPDCVFWLDAGAALALGVNHSYRCNDLNVPPLDAATSE